MNQIINKVMLKKKKKKIPIITPPTIANLIIYPKLSEIVYAIKQSMITVIKSDTGSGKTIGIPFALGLERCFGGSIFCSVPTIAATISAHKYQQLLNPNQSIGFACEGNVQYDCMSKIVYCTAGHLFNKMIKTTANILNSKPNKYYNPWFCNVLILDEFHIRTKESDMCLCLWITSYNAWRQNPNLSRPPKLIIMSATLDTQLNILPCQPSTLSYSIQSHEITTVYDNESNKYRIDSDDRYIRAAEIAYKYHTENYPGVYLLFVPGKFEIDIVVSALEKYFINDQILIAHGELTLEDLLLIHDPPQLNKRKVIVATNIAECSITIDNVSLVVDTMTHREASSGLDESIQINLRWISKTNSQQRRGRTGRTCAGTYVIMHSEEFYNMLPDNITPELDRVSISYDILKLIKHGLDPKLVLTNIINEWQIDLHIDLLEKLGFIEKMNNENLFVSEMGNFCSEFPLSIRKSAMLYHLLKIPKPSIFLNLAVICTLNCYGSGIFYWPRKAANEDIMAYTMRKNDIVIDLVEKYGGYSDVDTIYNIWIDICQKINPFYITALKNYCRENHLNFRRLKETSALLRQCIHICGRMGFDAKYHVNEFKEIDRNQLSVTFYNLLTLTHQEYQTTITQGRFGGVVAKCCGLVHQIDNRSIHLMDVGNNINQVYYALIRSQRSNNSGINRTISVLHGLAEHDVPSGHLSLFASDTETDNDSDCDEKSLRCKSNWTKFLSLLETECVIDPEFAD